MIRMRKTDRWIEFRGERLRIIEWERKLKLSIGTIHHRLKRGWTIERALTQGAWESGQGAYG